MIQIKAWYLERTWRNFNYRCLSFKFIHGGRVCELKGVDAGGGIDDVYLSGFHRIEVTKPKEPVE
jgi:hypothetical protein